MNYILATFASRNETMAYARVLRKFGLSAQIINTPAAIMSNGCSISVTLPQSALAMAQRLLSGSHFATFRGFYYVHNQNGIQLVEPI